MAKGTTKTPKESKCRGSGAPVEGRDWVKIGGNKWLREIAEKQGKFIPLEYREKSGGEFVKERAERAAEAEAAQRARDLATPIEEEIEVPDAEPQDASPFSTQPEFDEPGADFAEKDEVEAEVEASEPEAEEASEEEAPSEEE